MTILLYPQNLFSTQVSYLDFLSQLKFLISSLVFTNPYLLNSNVFNFNMLSIFCNLNKPYHSSDKVQSISNFIQLGLQYSIFLFQASNKLFLLNYIFLVSFPYSQEFNTFLLNGHKRTYIWSLKRDTEIYFDYYIKNKQCIYRSSFNITDKIFNSIELSEDNISLIFNSYRINILHLFSFFGISIQSISTISRYGKTHLFKKLIYNSLKLYSSYATLLLTFKKITNTIPFIEYVNFLTSLKLTKFSEQSINLVADLLYVIDQLIDYKLNKKTDFIYYNISNFKVSSNLSNNIYFKYLTENILNFIIPFYLNKTKFAFNKKIYYSKNFNKVSLKTRLFNELLHLNPLLQYTEELNFISSYLHSRKLNKINSISKISSLLQRDVNPSFITKLSYLNTVEGQHSGLVSTLTEDTILKNTGEFLLKQNLKTSKVNTLLKTQFSPSDNIFNISNSYTNTKKTINLIHKNLIFSNLTLNNTLKDNLNFYNNVSVKNVLSLGELLTPFFNYNEPSRCLMSSHMHTQSIPLIYANLPFLVTDSQFFLQNLFNLEFRSLTEGIVSFVSNHSIIIKDIFNRTITYNFINYKSTNQGNIITYYPLVWVGERVNSGTLLVGYQSETIQGYNVGTNLCVTYGYYSGHEHEDALLLNQKLLYSNIFSSLHFSIFEINYCLNSINKGMEYSTRRIPKQSKRTHRGLDKYGIISEGFYPVAKELLATKIFLSSDVLKDFSSLELFIQQLFSTQIRELKDNSLYMSKEKSGRVVKIETFLSELKDILKYRIFLCSLRLVSVGDKLSGRYGNKGIVAKFINPVDLPYRYDLIPDIITSSLGIPSRMNLGQLYETLLGLFSFKNNITLSLNSTQLIQDASLLQKNLKTKALPDTNIYNSNKITLIDGKFGLKFLESNVIGFSFFLKLIHMVKTKIHVRGIGPYTEIFQQPLKGKGKEGGQRLGEMEIWALQAYGASYTIRDLLLLKSDDLKSRNNFQLTQLAIEERQPATQPESLRLLLRELNGLALNIDNLIIPDYNLSTISSEKSNINFN